MSKANLYFGGDSDSDVDDSTALPFPKPLDRSAFLDPEFNAADFLSSLTSRFQTLEDLQTELQDLLKSLNKELVDLVNDNYTDFLSLGEKLKGGDDRIEEVRVGLLGFQRDVTGLRNLVDERSQAVKVLLDEKRQLRRDIRTGRTLLEIDERLQEIELRLEIARPITMPSNGEEKANDEDQETSGFQDWSDEWAKNDTLDGLTDDEDEEDMPTISDIPPRLKRTLTQLKVVQALATRCSEQHPYILGLRDRIGQIKDILRRDLETAIRRQPDVRAKQRIIQMRAELD